MQQKAWNAKLERQNEHIKGSLSSINAIPVDRRGGLRSHQGAGGRTLLQLHNEASQRGVKGRSTMNKAQLETALVR